MILGKYRNPPYRSPTPSASGSSLSPPPQHHRISSPKRTRPDHLDRFSPEPTQAFTIDLSSGDGIGKVPDSPGTKVAERLRGLEIRQAGGAPGRGGEGRGRSASPSPRKKVRREGALRDLRGEVQARRLWDYEEDVRTPQFVRTLEVPDSVGDGTLCLGEVAETPDARGEGFCERPDRGEDVMKGLKNPDEMVMDDEDGSRPQRPSPPRTKRPISPPSPPTSDPFTPSPSSSSTLTWTSSLTWQDSEITGHHISAPDDDGEGINGIGFRPTAAIAQARSQKRRAQVSEWKAREAREARQRRVERRRGESGGGSSGGAMKGSAGEEVEGRRMVRFEMPGAS